ncbi:MAG: glycoside hydrolase family 99-like domain-containing protein [Xylophilus ampelinus]
MKNNSRVIAIYLPQYHPIPENDQWWGKGFTEWTNVTKARPLFKGQHQPNLPADLGFYDLRVPETRAAQAAMAKEYGIEGFCYYHYWFAGRRILERPFEEVLASGEPDFPFCLFWANETWSGIWHGNPKKILIEQSYPGEEDHRKHFEYLLQAFQDKRYIRADGKPVFLIYRPHQIPDVKSMIALWRKLAAEAGLEGLHLIANNPYPDWNAEEHGFDACINSRMPSRRGWVGWTQRPLKRLRQEYAIWRGHPTVYDYESIMGGLLRTGPMVSEEYPLAVPNWDNTPRSGANGLVLQGATPELFRVHMRDAVKLAQELPEGRRFIFVKSWNEWAEGNYLEPDRRFGSGYLQVIRDLVAPKKD